MHTFTVYGCYAHARRHNITYALYNQDKWVWPGDWFLNRGVVM